MTRCTCLWTTDPAGGALGLAVLLPDPVCPAEAVHRRARPAPCSCELSAVVEHALCAAV